MANVGLFEAKTHLSGLLDQVARGEEITITRHGTPVARLVPMAERQEVDPRVVGERIRAARRGSRLQGASIHELIAEGRRY